MFDKTKEAIAAEIAKTVILIDPAPMPGSGLLNVLNGLKEDIRKLIH